MKIEEKILTILKEESINYVNYIEDDDETREALVLFSDDFGKVARKLTNLFKSYARSLVPEEMEYDETFSDDFREGYNYCREEMLRRIEEG